ncbi:tetratricopeptide repeat protein [Duganella sp. LX20W]|uniref:Tetratricopeptide repeat protein n=1 Tax=Rugamonas brunnea TaxID=2758569 RepID=A0A7W2EX20_9BURK|nr:tetratricopeptide repeat protein [Rugamonas brunnea]MBA5640192.1 tetratricopeptide repeat protein [Rugamonas brunnea]
MSLINKMLQDLDARGGKPGAAPGEQELRPVAAPRKRMLPVLLGVGAVGMVGLAAGSWWGWHYFTSHTVKPRPAPVMVVVPQAQAQAPASAPAPAPAAASEQASVVNAGGDAAAVPAPAPVAAAAEMAVPASHLAGASAPARHRGADTTGPVLSDDVDSAAAPRPHQRKHDAHKHDAREANAHSKAERHKDGLASRHGEKAKPQSKPANKEEGAQAAGGVSRDLGPAQLAENRYRRALQDLQEGRNAEAMAELQRAVELAPRHEAARQTLVTLLIENHRTDEAIQQLQQALALDARQPDMAMLLARLQLENGGPALDTLLRTLPYAGDNAEYQGFVAGVLQRAQRHGEAAEHYQAALKLAPQKGVWWMGLGISLQAEKRLPEARVAYTRAKAAGGLTPELQAFIDRKLEALGR